MKSTAGSASYNYPAPGSEPSSEERMVASSSPLHSPAWEVSSSSPASSLPAVCIFGHETKYLSC